MSGRDGYYFAQKKGTGECFVLRSVSRETVSGFDEEAVGRRLEGLVGLEDDNVVRTVEYWFDAKGVKVVTEQVGNSLGWRVEEGPISMDDMRRWMREVFLGLEYMHSRNLGHGNLKLSSVFFVDEKSKDVRIGDFGIVEETGEESYERDFGALGRIGAELLASLRPSGSSDSPDKELLGLKGLVDGLERGERELVSEMLLGCQSGSLIPFCPFETHHESPPIKANIQTLKPSSIKIVRRQCAPRMRDKELCEIVAVRASSTFRNAERYSPDNLREYNSVRYWSSEVGEGEHWVEFEFAEPRVVVEMRVRTCQFGCPESIIVSGGEDGIFEVIERVRCEEFRSHGSEVVVEIGGKKAYKKVRLSSDSRNHLGGRMFIVGGVEFYGKVGDSS